MKKTNICLVISIILIVLTMNLALALDFDNVKVYNETISEGTYNNCNLWVGTCLMKGDEIGKAKLITPHIYYVMPGQDRKVAEFDIDLKSNTYTDAIKELELYNNKDGKAITRDISYKYKNSIPYEVEVYKNICVDGKEINKTTGKIEQICENKIIGTETRYNEIWTPLEKLDLTKGKITIGLFTDVLPDDDVEFVPTIFGVRSPEFATWTSSYNVNLTAYWKFDETSGNLIDSLGISNGTLHNVTQGTTGIITKAYNVSGGKNSYVNVSDNAQTSLTTANMTINMWIRPRTMASVGYIVSKNATAAYSILFNSGNPRVYAGGTTTDSAKGMVYNAWQMLTVTITDGTVKIYINGTEVTYTSQATGVTVPDTTGMLYIGSYSDPNDVYNYNGSLDEMALAKRAWSSTEITDAYNNGAGITYTSSSIATSLISPANGYTNMKNGSVIFNCSAISSVITIVNMSLWTNQSGTWAKNKTNTLTGTANSTTFTNNYNDGKFGWSCVAGASDGSSDRASENRTVTIDTLSLIVNSISYSNSTYDTEYETFSTNVTFRSGTLTAAYLNYNNTIYPSTNTLVGINSIVSYSMDIPTITSLRNNTFYFIFNNATTNFTTSNYTQLVTPTIFDICNATFNISYFNITFQDELTLYSLNESVNPLTLTYWLGNGTVTKYLSYSNITTNPGYPFCLNANPATLYTNGITVRYYNTDYLSRQVTLPYYTLTNVTTNKILYSLSSTDGQYVNFYVSNQLNQPIQGVYILINSSTLTTSAYTDTTGIASFFLSPISTYYLYVNKTGYDSYSATIIPSLTSYTIVLVGGATNQTTNNEEGISYQIQPSSEYLVNDTVYNFNFTINSPIITLTGYGFNLTNSTGAIIGTASGNTGSGGIASANINSGDSDYLVLSAYWIYNGTTLTTNKYYTIYDSSGTGNSILNFITDFKIYLSTGIFGLKTGFGMNLIIFLIIFVTTGVLSYRFGLYSPAAISSMVFFLILLFDVVFGLVSQPINAVPHFVSIFVGITWIVIMIKEVGS